MKCVYLVSVHPLRVPTLKMAVWLFLPCAGGPNSGRKSDAQRPFPRIQDAQSHACSLLAPSQFRSAFDKQQKHPRVHYATSRNIQYFNFTSLFQFYFLATLRAHPHRRITHHESRLGERRVAALNDRCLFSALQVSHSDSLGQEGSVGGEGEPAVMSIQ